MKMSKMIQGKSKTAENGNGLFGNISVQQLTQFLVDFFKLDLKDNTKNLISWYSDNLKDNFEHN